jgi:Amidohydrolase
LTCLCIHPRPSHNAVQYDSHPELTGAAWGFAPETATHALRIGGNFNTQASLHCTMLTMGADRILFASDYPYEDYAEAGEFMDTVAISESDRRKIAYGNAKAPCKL